MRFTNRPSTVRHLERGNLKNPKLFFETLRNFPYDRSKISKGGRLEKILADAFSFNDHDKIDTISQKNIQKTLIDAHLSLNLGIKPRILKSEYHMTYDISNRFQEILGVFKPIINIDPEDDDYGSAEGRDAHLSEVAKFSIDRYLGFELVPYTTLFTSRFSLSDRPETLTGSFQMYVNNCDLMQNLLEGTDLFDTNYEALKSRLNNPHNCQFELQKMEELIFSDMMVGNNDCHFKNILVKKLSDKVLRVISIDNGLSFPWCHDLDLPSNKVHPNHWFKWLTLPQAQKPFSDNIIKRIEEIYQSDINKMEEILRKELVDPSSITSHIRIDQKIETFRERLSLITKLASQRINMSDIALEVLKLRKKS